MRWETDYKMVDCETDCDSLWDRDEMVDGGKLWDDMVDDETDYEMRW